MSSTRMTDKNRKGAEAMMRAARKDDDDNQGPSRELIEKLVLLEAIGTKGCSLHDLTVRLGLSPALVSAVEASTEPLISDGFLFHKGETVIVTSAGEAWFESRLAELLPGHR